MLRCAASSAAAAADPLRSRRATDLKRASLVIPGRSFGIAGSSPAMTNGKDHSTDPA
jgi:hypothetical protein